jgi:hypothetical protein
LYWLQTEKGLAGLRLRPDIVGTDDGLAMMPYIRESRRIKALLTLSEQEVSASCNPGQTTGPHFDDSVGIGCYRIDLHPSTSGASYIDLSSLPFQIPLRSLIPVRLRNLLPACKNLGVTHIANGCTRLHPTEMNIGESAAVTASVCVERSIDPTDLLESETELATLKAALLRLNIETDWPLIRAV